MSALEILSSGIHLNNAEKLTDPIVDRNFRTGQRFFAFYQTLGPRPTAYGFWQ